MNGNYNRQGNNDGSFGGFNGQGNNIDSFGGFNGQGNNNNFGGFDGQGNNNNFGGFDGQRNNNNFGGFDGQGNNNNFGGFDEQGNNNNFGGFKGQGNNGQEMNNPGFGGNASQQYDPYKPENSYDPNAPLYTPSSNSYTSTTVTTNTKKATNPVVIVIVLLAIAVAVGLYFYVKNRKITISEYAKTVSGQRELADVRDKYGDMYKDDGFNFDIYITDNNEYVFEYSFMDYQAFSDDDLSYFKEYLDNTVEKDRAEYERVITETMQDNNVAEFSIMYRVKNSDGTLLYEHTIGLSH